MSDLCRFEQTARADDCEARAGKLFTRRGEFETPLFMPVGTSGTIKAIDPEELRALGFGVVLANTYHLLLRPGPEVVAAHGSLHGFMDWHGSILTDSGGYQVFSLAALRKINEEKVTFRSHIDGSEYELSPERAIEIQQTLGSDIMMVLDECPPHDAPASYHEESCARTTRWARRCLDARSADGGALFGIIQGGLDERLRLRHLEELSSMPFEGMALGGLSVGEGPERMEQMVAAMGHRMDPGRPRYLMGVGLPQDIIRAVSHGMDMFDCVVPTRNARNGQLFTFKGPLQIRHAAHSDDTRPVDEDCPCPACRRFSRAYLRHLYLSNEILGVCLNTLHNLTFYSILMERIRQAIRGGNYLDWAAGTLAALEGAES